MKRILTIFHAIAYYLSDQKALISEDIEAWYRNYQIKGKPSLYYLLIKYPAFRSVFIYRIKRDRKIILKSLIVLANLLLKEQLNLYIITEDVKGGLFFLHGFSTIVTAKSIGKNCWINQQVTVGYTTPDGAPIIKDNVKIFAGAKVLGNITVGDNVIIGANAVVIKNVPDNCTVVGVPAYIIKQNGVKVRLPL